MQPIDRSRFIYSLAGLLLAGEWSVAGIKKSLKIPPLDRPIGTPKFAEKLLTAFPSRPPFDGLVELLSREKKLFRLSFQSIIRKRPRRIQTQQMDAPPARMRDLQLPNLPTEAALAEWFGMGVQHLRWRADTTGRNRRYHAGPLRTYRHRWIAKCSGMPRLLEIPKVKLKIMQRKILAEILDLIPVHPAAHGFCVARSILTNVKPHCGKATVLRFDLTDFFPSVTAARVFRIFRTIGYPADIARLLMGLCTTSLPADVWDARPGARSGADFLTRQRLITRHLPQGAPTSPALANLAAGRLDRRLAAMASKAGASYTRYADDMTFSGDSDLARSRKRLATLVAVIADDEGFSINHRKTRIMRAGVRQHVTGVVVNVRPNISRVEFDRLKAILTNCIRHGIESQNRGQIADFRARLSGKVAFVCSIHPTRGQKLKQLLARL